MMWTKELPKSPGYYWIYSMIEQRGMIVHVIQDDTQLFALECGDDSMYELTPETWEDVVWSAEPLQVPQEPQQEPSNLQ